MELELKRTESAGYDSILETTLFSEETLECIVPDSCPDILRIVDCTGIVCVKNREILVGRAEVRGTVYASVLYLPDGGDTLCHMDVTIPFLCSTEHSFTSDDMMLHVMPRLIGADARVLNPRKIYIRAEIAVGMQIFAPSVGTYTVGTYDGNRWGIEEKRETCRSYCITAVQDKSFTYADELVLPGNKPNIEALLYCRAELFCSEHKVIGSKLVLKGQVSLKAFYCGTDQSLNTAMFELPFSQIMEMSQACEDADGMVNLYLTEITCQATEEEPRKIAVTMEVMAQAVLRTECTEEILTDLYSTAYAIKAERTVESFTGLCERGTHRVPVREVLEVPVAVKSVTDFWLNMGEIRQKRDGNTLVLSADVRASVIYTGEDDSLYALKRLLVVECQISGEEAEQCACRCQCMGELYATPTVGGIELRFPLDFEYCTETKTRREQVSFVSIEETQPYDMTLQPSIVLRLAEEGETLWQIAKTYKTTKQEIALVNEISEETELAGQLLLIPKRR